MTFSARVESALQALTPTERRVLRLRFGLGVPVHTLDEIAQEYAEIRDWVAEIERRALRKLRYCL